MPVRSGASLCALTVGMDVYGIAIVQTRLFFVATPAHVMINGHCRPLQMAMPGAIRGN